ncbi:MAG: hypothetical protein IT292_07855 [Deltaproteobacteria bacterium]|nr:hypothetical protein [Deltaproteobacteria bacterium]
MSNFQNQRGSVRSMLLSIIILLIVLWGGAYFVFGTVVPPNYIGIRQNYFGTFMWGEKGFLEKGLEPGLHIKVPFITTIHLIPRDFQFIHFLTDELDNMQKVNRRALTSDFLPQWMWNEIKVEEPLDIPTADGSKVRTEVTLILRYFDASFKNAANEVAENPTMKTETTEAIPMPHFVERTHGGPGDLVNTYTIDRKLQLSRIAQIAENEVKKSLSFLSTLNYYDPVARETRVLRAQDNISNAVNTAGVEIWGTLIRRYLYQDQAIDDQIYEKNLQEQQEALNRSFRDLSEQKAITEQQLAEWDAKINVLNVTGETQAKVIRSQGNLHQAQKAAEGDLKIAEAKARVDSERAHVLSAVSGADVYVAREMLPFIGSLSGGIVGGFDPFDINKWLNRLVSSKSE